MVLLRMIFQPGPNEFVDLKFGILLALSRRALVAYGGWDSMKEEGTTFDSARDQLQSRYGRAGRRRRDRTDRRAARGAAVAGRASPRPIRRLLFLRASSTRPAPCAHGRPVPVGLPPSWKVPRATRCARGCS